MVKSYRGVEKAKPARDISLPVTVRDHMTRNLITFHPDQTINVVADKLLDKRISGAPVIDDDGNLVGIISEGDCLKQIVKGKYNNHPTLSGRVSEYMAKDVKYIDPDVDIFELAQMFLSLRLRRFPVLENGKLIGQISQKDVMRAVIQLTSLQTKRV